MSHILTERKSNLLFELSKSVTFDRDEKLELKSKIELHELNLSKDNDPSDYIEYIRMLETITKLNIMRQSRRNMINRKPVAFKVFIEESKKLCQTVIRNYPGSVDWLVFQLFLQVYSHTNSAPEEFENLIKESFEKHISRYPKACLAIANWRLERKQTALALKVLKIGLKHHQQDQDILKEYIKFETTLNSSQDEASLNKVLLSQLRESIEHIKDASFYIELLTLLNPHTNTTETQKYICNHLLSKHTSNSLVWDCMAQRRRRNLPLPSFDYKNTDSSHPHITESIEMYKRGLQSLSEDNAQYLWNFYIDYLFEIAKDMPNADLILGDLVAAINEATRLNYLQPKYYVKWLDYISYELVEDFLKLAVRNVPFSIDLWKLRINYEICKDTPDMKLIEAIFQQAIDSLGEDSLPLFKMQLRHHIMSSDANTTEKFFEKALQQPWDCVKTQMGVNYLQWLCMEKGLLYILEKYHELPARKEFYLKMHELQRMQIACNLNEVEAFHKFALQQFPKDMEVFVNSLTFYVLHKRDNESKRKVLEIYQKAKDNLDDESFLKFNREYNEVDFEKW